MKKKFIKKHINMKSPIFFFFFPFGEIQQIQGKMGNKIKEWDIQTQLATLFNV